MLHGVTLSLNLCTVLHQPLHVHATYNMTELTVVVVVFPDGHELAGRQLLDLPRVGVPELPHEVGRHLRNRLRLATLGLHGDVVINK